MTRLQTNLLFVLLLCRLTTLGQHLPNKDYWLAFVDTTKDACGYKNQNGDTVIEPGKYSMCFTDTFRTYAIVLKQGSGFVAIDRQQHILYQVFPFDNGPDDTSEGRFQILKNQFCWTNTD